MKNKLISKLVISLFFVIFGYLLISNISLIKNSDENNLMEFNQIYSDYKDYDSFIRKLNSDLTNPDDNISLLTKNSSIACSRDIYYTAIEKLKKDMINRPNDYQIYYFLGRTYFLTYEFNDSILMLEKSIKLNPIFANSYFELYLVYTYIGEFEKAKETLSKFQSHIFEDYDTTDKLNLYGYYIHKSEIFYLNLDFYNATKALDIAIKLNPEDSESNFNLGRIYFNQGNFTLGLNKLQESVRLNNESANSYLELGKAFFLNGKYDMAFDAMNKSLHLNQNNFETYSELGWMYYLTNDSVTAEKMFTRAINLNQQCDEVYTQMGQFYYLLGEINKSQGMYIKSFEFEPDLDHIYARWGWFYYFNEEYTKSKEMFHKAILYSNDSKTYYYYVDYYNGLVLANLKEGDINNSVNILKKSIEQTPGSVYKEHKKMALNYIEQGDLTRSISILEQSSKIPFDIYNDNFYFKLKLLKY